jgi:hypothetical protein
MAELEVDNGFGIVDLEAFADFDGAPEGNMYGTLWAHVLREQIDVSANQLA